MYLIRIAVRNLFRRRTRTVVIGSILSVAVVCFLLLESFMVAMMDVAFDNVIDFETPHVEVGRAKFLSEADAGQMLPVKEYFAVDEALREEAQQLSGYRASTTALDFSADFIAGRYDFPVTVRAIDLDSFGDVFAHEDNIARGSFVDREGGAVIGKDLARFFDLEVGDDFTLRFQDKDGYFNTLWGAVNGILDTPHHEINQAWVFLAREDGVQGLGVPDEAVHRYMIRLQHREGAKHRAEELQAAIGGSDLEVRSYRDASELLLTMEAWGYIETYFILALFLLVGAIGIIAAVVLSALERIREIGMMKALGLKESEILRVFLYEAGGIGAIGGLIGCVVGGIGIWLFKVYGFPMDMFFEIEAFSMLPMDPRLYGVWNTWSFVLIFVIVVALAVASSVFPAWWAAKRDPIEAIRHR